MKELKLNNCRLDGRYDIFDCLGRGSYSEIYRARLLQAAPGSESEVVIKALNVFLQGTPEADLERTLIENFQNEALALDRVRHPNIIKRLGHGTAIDMAGQPFHYLVLEYLPGGDLYTICREKAFRLENALYYLEQVCAGLAYAHACGVIHRDIKPQNLLLTADRRTVKIADFGVAKLNLSEEQITRVGTNVYAPPEHSPAAQDGEHETAPRQRLTPAADIYSLAKTLYTLLVGESPRRYIHRPLNELPYPLSERPWALGVARVLSKATQTAPAERFQRVQDFWQELADAVTRAAQTQVAAPEAAAPRHHISRELTAPQVAGVTAAPPQPAFEPASLLQNDAAPQYAEPPSARARLVVPVAEPPTPPAAAPPGVREVLDQQPSPVSTRRSTRLLVAAFIIMAFVGMLLATNYYVRNYVNKPAPPRNDNRAGPVSPPNNPPSKPPPPTTRAKAGDEGVAATTDVNLRSGPSSGAARLGVVGKGSRVRVVQVKGSWAEVEVTDYVAPATPGLPRAERGWLNTKNIKF
jgi:serine/threonine protein kinase